MYAALAESYCHDVSLNGLKTITLCPTDVFLLLVHVANLKPYVLLTEWSWWVGYDISETLCGC